MTLFTFFVQETFLMQMPAQPPAERPRGQQTSGLMGGNAGFLWLSERLRVDAGPMVKGCRPASSHLAFANTHTHEMFHVARRDYKLLGLTRIHLFIEYSVVFLIAIQRDYSIPSLWLGMVLNGLHAFLNRKPRRNNRYQVTTGIQSHSEW